MIMDICTYNIRGLNNKQSFVKDFINLHQLSFIALLETRVKEPSAQSISKFISPNFTWMFNYSHHRNGRIWVGFNANIWNVLFVSCSAQHINCSVRHLNSGMSFLMSFVYAFNGGIERRPLWQDLVLTSTQLPDGTPWCVCGDFNICLGPSEASYLVRWNNHMEDFRSCLSRVGLSDLRNTGPIFTWWDCCISSPKFKKLDRCLVNGDWLATFGGALAKTLPRGISDHSPIGILLGLHVEKVHKPFQFFNHLIYHRDFLEVVRSAWNIEVAGNPWFILTSKLKSVKVALRRLNSLNGNLQEIVLTARNNLLSFQENLPLIPSSSQLQDEKTLIDAFNKALLDEELFLKQKSRVKWLKCGDANNGFFFKSCRNRWNQNKILQITDDNGVSISGHREVANVAVEYYRNLLGNSHGVADIPADITLPRITEAQSLELLQPFNNDDIFCTLKSMPKNKSPGPDGFPAEFYVATWAIVGDDVCRAIMYFFHSLHMPRMINSAVLALVPKCQSPTVMADFRPIACCNTLYKCITKLIASRLKCVLPALISSPQSAFIPGRKIGDNILLAQALLRDYHHKIGPSRCAFKVDLRKAFDTLSWQFLHSALLRMGFPLQFINLVMTCVRGSMLSVKINGAIEGYFSAGSGLRQGDPLSPYLFVISMEILTACLQHQSSMAGFKHHWHTKELDITHIMFADDIFMFCHGDSTSISKLMMGLNQFSSCSGLHPNCLKSNFFVSNVDAETFDFIQNTTGFSEGTLPIKYLGLPLISSQLTYRLCLPLISRIRDHIDAWVNKCLGQAGRLQLIKAILFGMHNYWSMHFMLPKAVLKKIQSLFCKFLWGGSSDNTKLVKVSWSVCSLPKLEGGLGLRDLCSWNKAACLHQLWRILQPTDQSLWLIWFKRIFLKRRAFWTMSIPCKVSWCIRKILQLRHLALSHIRYEVGAFSKFLFWHDPWFHGESLLSKFRSDIISLADSHNFAEVGEYIVNSSWNLPTSNHLDIIELRRRILPISIHSRDVISWGLISNNQVSVTMIWDFLRPRASKPIWFDAVWHVFSIPKCSFLLWLVLKERLLTRDRMLRFNMQTEIVCVLCNNATESHSHLFGSCPYTSEVLCIKGIHFTGDWTSYTSGRFFLNRCTGTKKLVGFLFIASAFFLIWKERNSRIHDTSHCVPACTIRDTVKRMLREKLHSSKRFNREASRDFNLILDLY